MNNKIKGMRVVIKTNEHANLDSLSFRYGHFFTEDEELLVSDIKNLENLANDRQSFSASFMLPNSNKILTGFFIILKKDKTVITVINKNATSEFRLSEMIKSLRISEYITPADNIKMFKNGIKTYEGVIDYLFNKKVSVEITSKNSHIERLSSLLSNSTYDKQEVESNLLGALYENETSLNKIKILQHNYEHMKDELDDAKIDIQRLTKQIKNAEIDTALQQARLMELESKKVKDEISH
ncbi:MAG: hypothetical protein Ctma_0471 [Catillopecten margaritatus gill symbiont]|uniref:Uncharacterized protein n=1 Tax=Catillopecten margaritatus gill symbiont TaxID=3083288 RepID=A0AAU6PFJ2_9GAMM